MRTLFLALLAFVLASPAQALDLSPGRQFFSATCTDTNDTPATTVNVDVSDLTNVDGFNEAVDPDLNLGDAAQTSGSADGWCDDTPWIIKADWTTAGNSGIYVGPLTGFSREGIFFLVEITAMTATDYSFDLVFEVPWDATDFHTWHKSADLTDTTGTQFIPLGAREDTSSGSEVTDWGVFPSGLPIYLKFDMDGAGNFDFDVFGGSLKDLGGSR